MELDKYILNTYPTVKPFEGVNSVEDRLLKNQYLVVVDNDKKFYGILTPSDVVERPHKIVIDCVTPKESLSEDDTVISTIKKFCINQSYALPVMSGDNFIGIIEKNQIVKKLGEKTNELYSKSSLSENTQKYFLNNLSHEIKTPLNCILGFLDIIADLKSYNLTDIDKDISDTIRKQAGLFLIKMNDLVELSLLYAGDKLGIKKDNVDITKIFTELKDYFDESLLSQNKTVKVIYLNTEPFFNIYTDRNRLKSILYHLIDNAIKFTEDRRVVYGFDLEPPGGNVKIYVKNKAPDPCVKNRMFELFEKQENIGEELNPGLGIGLPMVKNLTELLGGYVKVESKDNEVTFWIQPAN